MKSMIAIIKNKLKRRKLISIIESQSPADSRWNNLSREGIQYIKDSGYQLVYTEWRSLPIWVLEYYAKRCILKSEGLLIKYPKAEV